MQDARIPVGPLDFDALSRIRRVFEADGLVGEIEWDDPINPQQLQVGLDDGIGEPDVGRIDAKWTVEGYYSFHYGQPGLNFRFDRHPKRSRATAHFHSPPDGTTVVPSCIEVTTAELVARAVHDCWREAYETGDPTRANTFSNPP